MTNWSADLGTLPKEEKLAEYLNQKRKLTVEVPHATQALLDDAEELRRAVSQGRPLEPGDFSAAADAGKPLTDDVERDLVDAGANKLTARVTMLAARLSADGAALVAAAGPVVAAARNYARLVSGGAADTEVALAMARLIQLRGPLDAALLKVSFLAEPSALRLITTTSIAGAPDDFERTVLRIADRLTTRQANLTAAAAATPGTNAAEARERRDALIAVMKSALDGDVLPILPPIAKVPETSPLLQPAAAPAADPVSGSAPVREKVARALTLSAPRRGRSIEPPTPPRARMRPVPIRGLNRSRRARASTERSSRRLGRIPWGRSLASSSMNGPSSDPAKHSRLASRSTTTRRRASRRIRSSSRSRLRMRRGRWLTRPRSSRTRSRS